ncbi:MAG: hypothetical protein JSW67_11245 [Candidatus Latescibacterota bacterium]|nr:MAG: hypothetical protein JSW67_11245 [Candidatus Latescibacterota bacterium]
MRLRHAMPTIFVVTACVLAFEVGLTRVCAVLLQHHVSFAVVSFAVLGLGVGGFAAFLATRHAVDKVGGAASLALLAVSPAMLLALFSLLRLPFAERWTFLLFLVLPAFVAAGAFQSLLLRALASQAGLLYGADLAGGAAGALVAVVAVDLLAGPVNTMLLLALVTAAVAWVWVRQQRQRARLVEPAAALLTVVAFLVIFLLGWTRFLEVRYELAPTAMLAPGSPAPGRAGLEIEATLAALPYRLLAPRRVLALGAGGALRPGCPRPGAVPGGKPPRVRALGELPLYARGFCRLPARAAPGGRRRATRQR